jgi:hypothetical protein
LQNYHFGFFIMLLFSVLTGLLGVFRAGGPVEQSAWTKWRLSKREQYVMLGGLEDRARYHHGEPFDALTEQQQKEIIDRYRVGNYMYPAADGKDRLDGAELVEWGRASSIALGRVSGLCSALAGVYGFATLRVGPEDLTAIFLTLGFFGMTGAKANVLWNETDVAHPGTLLQ